MLSAPGITSTVASSSGVALPSPCASAGGKANTQPLVSSIVIRPEAAS